jgi:hypothetical protein
MASKILVTTLACVIPCIAAAQQSPPAQSGVQAQGNASAQGGASIQRDGTKGATATSAAGGNASGSVSKGDKSVSGDSGAATNAMLSGALDAKKAKPGDPVTAKTTEPSTTADHTQLPKGTRLLGHVTEARPAAKGEAQSTLGFVFDRAVLKDGREVPINATVRALAAAEGAANAGGSDAMGSVGGSGQAMSGGGVGGGLGGAVGGVGATAGGALGGAGRVAGGTGNMAGGVAGGASGTMGSTAGASSRTLAGGAGAVGGLNAHGLLSTESQGVFGLQGVSLAQSASGTGSVVTSAGKNVHLDSGTRMLLSVEGSAAHSASAGQ